MKVRLLISLAFVLGLALGVFLGKQTAVRAQSGKVSIASKSVLVYGVNMLSGTGRTEIMGPVVGFSCVKIPGPADTNAECFVAFSAE
jgi:hypothetical protein